MKLKEMLAEEYLINAGHWNERMDGFLLKEYSDMYMEGFEKAREMAMAEYRKTSRTPLVDRLEKLGEEEV